MNACTVRFVDLSPPTERLLDVVREGLARRPRALPCTLFYDAEGSRLFDRICELPEYYIPRVEVGLLRQIGDHARAGWRGVGYARLHHPIALDLGALRCQDAARREQREGTHHSDADALRGDGLTM